MHLNKASSDSTFPEGHKLQLTCLQAHNNFTIECGEIDGVVLGSWTNIEEISAFPVIDEDNTHAGYWAGAAVWSDSWNQGTVDRVSHFFHFFCQAVRQHYVVRDPQKYQFRIRLKF